ncbi:hypothetical protein GCM10008018_45150 [Paenibacillus marchantiophytorum]|uniref:Uncharacterized protein n=1 Tax=Paenibacillus marchantiophytorum TaxID=1619310 RepID=A0ABQ1F0A3_9BACL|nr:hypothetical protein GCM10008018_45150 [Paenibacillus marchantiophytorum]
MAHCQSCGDKKEEKELILFDGTAHPELNERHKGEFSTPMSICLPCYYAITGVR